MPSQLLFVLVILAHHQGGLAQTCTPNSCFMDPNKFSQVQTNQTTSNYFYLGGLFSIHSPGDASFQNCGGVNAAALQHSLAFNWAVRSFATRYPNVLRDINIGALTFDTCNSEPVLNQLVLNFETSQKTIFDVTPNRLLGYTASNAPEVTASANTIAAKLGKPLISSGRQNFENVGYFSSPSRSDDLTVASAIIRATGWQYVQVIYSKDTEKDYAAFKEIIKSGTGCITNAVVFTTATADNAIQSLVNAGSTRVVLVLLRKRSAIAQLLEASRRRNLRGRFTWIGLSEWGDNNGLLNSMWEYAEGAVTIAEDFSTNGFEDFKVYLQNLVPANSSNKMWMEEFWKQRMGCSANCDFNRRLLTNIAIDNSAAYVIRAVDALLHGLASAIGTVCKATGLICSEILNQRSAKATIMSQLAATTIKGSSLFFNNGSSRTVKYNILNIRPPDSANTFYRYQKIGTFTKEAQILAMTDGFYFYNSEGKQIPQPNNQCKQPCLQCAQVSTVVPPTEAESSATPPARALNRLRNEQWVMVLLIITGVGLLCVVAVQIYLLYKLVGTKYCQRWKSTWLGQLLLLAILISYLTCFTFITETTAAACLLRRLGLNISYALMFTVLLVKLLILLGSSSFGTLKGVFQGLLFLFAFGIQLAVTIQWLILVPATSVWDASQSKWNCSVDFKTQVISLVYVMFLIVLCTILAVRTKKIKANDNERTFIGISASLTILIWITWILIGFLGPSSGYRDPAVAFGLFTTATVVLFVMFAPKIRALATGGVAGVGDDDNSLYAGSVIGGGTATGSVIAPSVAGSIIINKPVVNGAANSAIAAYDVPDHVMALTKRKQDDNGSLYVRTLDSNVRRNGGFHVSSNPRAQYVIREDHSSFGRVSRASRAASPRPVVVSARGGSEINFPLSYGTSRSLAGSHAGSNIQLTNLTRARSVQDLGPL